MSKQVRARDGNYFATIVGVGNSRIDEVLRDVDLGDNADRLVGQLSGGERARVSLATALLGKPVLLVLDETQPRQCVKIIERQRYDAAAHRSAFLEHAKRAEHRHRLLSPLRLFRLG